MEENFLENPNKIKNRTEYGRDFIWNLENKLWEATSDSGLTVSVSPPETNNFCSWIVSDKKHSNAFSGEDAEKRAFLEAKKYLNK
jgi:hypothetical protein